MMIRRLVLFLFLLLLAKATITAQEVVTGPATNHLLSNKAAKGYPPVSKNGSDTISLPFIDDFSYTGPYPDARLWADNFVFINNTYSVDQLTRGMATFDLLNENGKLYPWAETWTFPADMLTSRYINLDYAPADSIYFSFMYQPGGIGDTPEPGDSLTLLFWSPLTGSWHSVWKTEGGNSRPFRNVIIPVTQPHFLKKGFRFRFMAYGSLSMGSDPAMKSSCDNWNIDYVKLDKNRHRADTILHDVAFTLPLRSLLKTHETIPMKHFRNIVFSEMGSYIPVTYTNNDNVVRNVTRLFEIKNLNTGFVVHSYSGGATNINPGDVVSYAAPLFYTYETTGSDTVSFRVRSYLITDEFDRKENDTISYIQHFGNVFSFDDGSSEAGYGINGLGARNAMVAFRFRAWVPDTLRAIMICFNSSYHNASLRAFDLAVWNDDNGFPGEMIYSSEGEIPELGEEINGFHTYILDKPVSVNGIFFIGWKQRSETFLNAGVDLNTPHQGRQFYWLNGQWYKSQITGSLMIRAVTGPRIPSIGINDIPIHTGNISVWPNPVRDILYVEAGDNLIHNITIVIYDLSGREIIRLSGSNNINVSSLRPGIYILTTCKEGMITGKHKFIKIR